MTSSPDTLTAALSNRGRLSTLSCKQRGICPSCDAKRAAAFAAFLKDEVLENVGHCLITLTLPKMLRVYFMRNRELRCPRLCACRVPIDSKLRSASSSLTSYPSPPAQLTLGTAHEQPSAALAVGMPAILLAATSLIFPILYPSLPSRQRQESAISSTSSPSNPAGELSVALPVGLRLPRAAHARMERSRGLLGSSSVLRLLEPDKGILNAQAVHLLTVSEVFRE